QVQTGGVPPHEIDNLLGPRLVDDDLLSALGKNEPRPPIAEVLVHLVKSVIWQKVRVAVDLDPHWSLPPRVPLVNAHSSSCLPVSPPRRMIAIVVSARRRPNDERRTDCGGT